MEMKVKQETSGGIRSMSCVCTCICSKTQRGRHRDRVDLSGGKNPPGSLTLHSRPVCVCVGGDLTCPPQPLISDSFLHRIQALFKSIYTPFIIQLTFTTRSGVVQNTGSRKENCEFHSGLLCDEHLCFPTLRQTYLDKVAETTLKCVP